MKNILPDIFKKFAKPQAVPSMPLAILRATLDLEKLFAFYHELPLDNFNQGFWYSTVIGHPHEEPDLAAPEMMAILHCQKDYDHQLFRQAVRERNSAEMDRLMHKADRILINVTMPDDQVHFDVVTSINGKLAGLKTRSYDECRDETLSFIHKTSPQSIHMIGGLFKSWGPKP